MTNENYKVLGLEETCSDEELEAKYRELKAVYSEGRFQEGEAGNEAAKKLTELETAYAEILSERRERSFSTGASDGYYGAIEECIKKGDLAGAQQKLDEFNERNAEWHYLQSVVFYKKKWSNESKKQLEIAMNMDPHNDKYADSYTKLKQKIEFNEKQFHSGNAQYDNGAHRTTERQMGGSGANDCLSFCATWCCLDMLCSICCR